mmetsp:Transcript_12366/g.30330  ORF Transcript_12366/g.30330 Transcript_12366/m.30330 type:complete len:210 (-) Transcript_12366:1248-1877(-)
MPAIVMWWPAAGPAPAGCVPLRWAEPAKAPPTNKSTTEEQANSTDKERGVANRTGGRMLHPCQPPANTRHTTGSKRRRRTTPNKTKEERAVKLTSHQQANTVHLLLPPNSFNPSHRARSRCKGHCCDTVCYAAISWQLARLTLLSARGPHDSAGKPLDGCLVVPRPLRPTSRVSGKAGSVAAAVAPEAGGGSVVGRRSAQGAVACTASR